MWTQFLLNNDCNIAWSVPVDWQEIASPAPSTDTIIWQTWVNNPEAASIQYPTGQMTLTVFVENVAGAAAQPEGTEQFTYWGHPVWTQEIKVNHEFYEWTNGTNICCIRLLI